MSDVNPHYLDHVVKLSETSDIEASEDIVTGTGMKLLAKGAKIDARARERLLEFRLSKPLENMMRVVGGTDPAQFHGVAAQLVDKHPLLRGVCASAKGFKPINALKDLNLTSSVQSLLSVYAGQSAQRLEHAVGVALLMSALGGELTTNPSDHTAMVVSGLVHDVGELYIDPAFLARGVRLSPQQWKHVATHPIVGSHVLGSLPGAGPRIANVVMAHHERLDGFGYPQGTLGASLTMAGQVLAVSEMLMGIAESGTEQVEKAVVAMKLVPGEFNRRFIDRIALGARAAAVADAEAAGSADGAAGPSAHELHARVATLAAAIHHVRAMRGSIAAEMARYGAPLRSLLIHAFERWERIAIAFSSTGLDLGGESLLASMTPRDLVEVGIVLRELQFRITELERQLMIRSELFGPDEAKVVGALVEQARRPATEPAPA